MGYADLLRRHGWRRCVWQGLMLGPMLGLLAQAPARAAGDGWLPDWDVPEFGINWGPILGGSYQEWSVVRSGPYPFPGGNSDRIRTLTLEGGLRMELGHIPVYDSQKGRQYEAPSVDRRTGRLELPGEAEGRLALTLTPSAGYAYGRSFTVDEGDSKGGDIVGAPDREGSYHRLIAGLRATSFYRMVRYSLGVNFGRVFGDPRIGIPSSQGDIVQDIALRLTQRSSLHLTPTTGRIYRSALEDYGLQYTDLWLHLRFNPFLAAVFDAGPGVSFDWYRYIQIGSRSTYVRSDFGWDIVGPLAIALNARYEVDASLDVPRSTASVLPYIEDRDREPLRDLGVPSAHSFRESDDLNVLFFAGLKGVLLGWSVGYMSLHEYKHAFEREGSRTSRSSQGFGLYGHIAL